MTASLHRLGSGSAAGLYYTNDSAREARPDRRDEYYLSEGGGRWFSTGGTVVRHDAAVDPGSFRDLCAGRNPRDGSDLVRGAGEDHWAGLDLTLTPGKSVSLLWAAGTPENRAEIERAHRGAVDRALRFIVDEGLVSVRAGAGGRDRYPPEDFIVAAFDHYTTRDGDPNLHTHCVLMNVAGAPAKASSGRYRFRHLTIEPHDVFVWKLVIGAAYRAELSKALRTRFGFEFRAAGKGQWEVAGISQSMLDRFSSRSAAITAHAGANASAAQREIAALATRRGKEEVPTGPELEALWHSAFNELGRNPWTELASRDPQRDQDPDARLQREQAFEEPEIAAETPVGRAANALFAHESVLGRKPLLQGSFERAGLAGLGPDDVLEELAGHERSGALVALQQSERTQHWTTTAVAEVEAAMLRAAARFDERAWFTPEAVEAALTEGHHLAPEQAEAVRHAASRDGVALLEAGAGTGKTTTMTAVVAAAQGSGLTVIGLAPSWVAADELGRATGVETAAIARWRRDGLSGGRPPADANTVIIIDEAGMVSTRDMEAVLSTAQRGGAKVLLVGDRRQLASVAGASALRAVAEVVERSAVLQSVRRQQVPWQQAASTLMARGDSEAGLRAYASRGRVDLVSGETASLERTIAIWRDQRATYGESVLIITRRNRDAAALNQRARTVLREEGKLGPDLVSLASRNRDGKHADLTIAKGDLIRFGETLPQLAIRNGNRARVEAVDTSKHATNPRLRFRLEDGRVLEEVWSRLSREPAFGRKAESPRIVHAYAGTAYAAQGQTSEAAVLYVSQSTDAREVYVAMTRHRHEARLVVERERLDARCRLRQADLKQKPTTTAVLEELFREARQFSEKANVVDYVADRASFITNGRIEFDERATFFDPTRAIAAARKLHEAVQRIAGEALAIPAWRVLDAQGRRLFQATKSQVRRATATLTARLPAQFRERQNRGFGPER